MESPRSKRKIFENDFVESLGLEYKRTGDFLILQTVCANCQNLIDSIIRINKFDKKVAFLDLRQFLFQQLPKWLEKWSPGKSKLYSYISSCIKNGCISMCNYEAKIQKRHVYTDLPLDALGELDVISYETNMDEGYRQHLNKKLDELKLRWDNPEIHDAVKYMLHCVLQNKADSKKTEIITTAEFAFDMERDTAKFLLDWTQGMVRTCMLDYFDYPLSEQEIIRSGYKFSFVPDLIDLIGYEHTKKVMLVFAGISIRFPTRSQITKWNQLITVLESLKEDPSPENMVACASRLKMSVSKLQKALVKASESVKDEISDGNSLDSEAFSVKLGDDAFNQID